MKKKILSLVLGSAMLTASAMSLAGCGHKHNYEVYYQLADCDSEGYTLHTCKDCGYQYADEFIAPYGHAYIDAFHIIEDEDTARAASYSLTRDGDPHYSLNVPVSAEDLEMLKEAGDKMCIHKDCSFCDKEPTRWIMTPDGHFVQIPASMWYNFDQAFYDFYYVTPRTVKAPVYSSVSAAPVAAAHVYGTIVAPCLELKDDEPVIRNEITLQTVWEAFDGMERTAAEENKVIDMINLIIPDSIEVISDDGIASQDFKSGICAKLERVYLSKKLKTIGKYAFNGSSIDSVIIPQSLQSIGSGAFGNCDDLKVVYFEGEKEEWEAIQIASQNDSLTNALRYYYSETKPSSAGNFWHYVQGEPTRW